MYKRDSRRASERNLKAFYFSQMPQEYLGINSEGPIRELYTF
jgi:hypothetical protein